MQPGRPFNAQDSDLPRLTHSRARILQAIESCVEGSYEAQESMMQDAQYRYFGRLLGGKRVPGAETSKTAALRALTAILETHNDNRNRAYVAGASGPELRLAST